MKISLLFLLFFSLNAFSQEEIEYADEVLFNEPEDSNIFFREKDFINHNVKKSHFFMSLETSLLMYKSDLAFTGQKATLESTDSLPLIGPALSLGYRFKIFDSISTSSQASLYRFVNRDHAIDKASKEIPLAISEQEHDNNITGLEFAQRFYLNFELSERSSIEPFIQVGLGLALSEAKYEHYFYDYIQSEYYYAFVSEQILTQNVAVGFNIMTQNGIFFIFKVQKNILTIGEQKVETSQFPLGAGVGTPTNTEATLDIDSNRDEYSVTLGGGYIF